MLALFVACRRRDRAAWREPWRRGSDVGIDSLT